MTDAIPFARVADDARPPATHEILLTDIPGLAPMLGMSVRHLRRMDCVGDIPGRVTLGRRVMFKMSEIRAWVAAGCPDRATWLASQTRNGRR